MDYPERWKQKLPSEEERRRKAEAHWRPTWWEGLLVPALIALLLIVFWPGGCGAPPPG
jgi:hypothetical protein